MLAEDQSRLQKIDELYDLRLDQYVSLPQLVVVGDQSSGKSSVLEGLTGLPFPRDSGLCTRFPTQIVFKRSRVLTTEASIMAAHGQDGSKVDAIAKFGKKQLEAFDQKTFFEILVEASECMGLPLPGRTREVDMESFSHNILKIELSGPEYEHFSVVDLPGLFRKPTVGQTTKVDMALVRQMVGKYLSNPRSIILAVVPANVDIATQEIIQMAEDADPHGQRTLGVLTKPDLVDKGAEDKVMELVTNTKGKGRFELGYTIVCNRSQSDLNITFDERNAKEVAFFNLNPWSSIPKQRAGIKALKHRLDNLLIDVTRRNFQGVTVDIRRKIGKLEKQLEIIGPVRQTAYDQRNHLINVASRFRELTTKAIDAYYSRDEFFEKDNISRLATLVIELNEQFSEAVHKKGLTRAFGGTQPTVANLPRNTPSPARSPDRATAHSSTRPSTPETELPEYPELQSIITQTETMPKSAEDGIMDWVTYEYTRSRGFEIGTINPSLMPSLFAEQSRAWGFHAQNHVTKVILKIHQFNHKVLQYCCNDDALCEKLWEMLLPPLLTSYKKALQQASFLVEVERHGNLITMNHYFAENVRKAREARLKVKLENLMTWSTDDKRAEPLLRLNDILGVVMSNDDHTIQDLHDTLKSYYKVARKRFVDAICLQVVDHFLVSGITSPLWVFSPHFIGKMSDAELQLIAGDEDEIVSRRNMLETELGSLKAGERILET
ncbi:vacuolar sorting protein VPS1, dynamin [Xylariales sp. AK1849]|nr:vacuolar sorting protein VPS1, dynamin [Xylariales sp. AK1849]